MLLPLHNNLPNQVQRGGGGALPKGFKNYFDEFTKEREREDRQIAALIVILDEDL
jgi:hypothetical protein